MMPFPEIKTWRIPRSAWDASFHEMARDGVLGNEGVALWCGRRRDGVAEVTHVLTLRGSGVIKHPDLLMIDAALVSDVTDAAMELNARVIGQIHSHGAGYGTDLSPTDRRHGIAVPYFLSIVAPDYALRPNTRLGEAGVHVFEPGRGYRRLAPKELNERVHLVEEGDVQVIAVGGGP